MNKDDLRKELEKIDDSYENSFKKIRDINDVSSDSKNLWGIEGYKDFAKKMQDFTEDMERLENDFKEYENEVSGITSVSERLDDYYHRK